MMVMPACSTGWFWHCMARETGRIGHLYSPGSQRGPWPWFPYALDNGCFSLWDPANNTFDEERWLLSAEGAWQRMLFWVEASPQRPLWLIVPDRPGDKDGTLEKWEQYAPALVLRGVGKLAIAVQDGMTPDDVRGLYLKPDVICVGGSTDWKWSTVEMWASEFPRVHLLRCNAPAKLAYLEELGVESTDGTGWNRGDRKQTQGLETWARSKPVPQTRFQLTPYVCRAPKDRLQEVFA